MKYFILFGPPGAGKGTQAAAIEKKFKLQHISTGELLRAEIAACTPLGKEVDVIISQGNLVPDSMVEKMLSNRIDALSASTENPVAGLLLDGFPRTLSQAEDLDKLVAKTGGKIDGVISLMIPDDMIAERISHRASIEGRADDAQEATILNRIKTYHEQTEPIIKYYKKAGCYHEVDGTKSISEVEESIDKLMQTL